MAQNAALWFMARTKRAEGMSFSPPSFSLLNLLGIVSLPGIVWSTAHTD
jgi:hypothetical protein